MQDIFKKLDLLDYIESFKKHFSRAKEPILEGDINIHFKLIKELSSYEFKQPPQVTSLDNAFMRIQKQAVLSVEDIFEFTKIINYFRYLQNIKFDGQLLTWFEKIIIPQEIVDITHFFTQKGVLKEGINEDYDAINSAIKANKESIKHSLYQLINNSKLRPYLVDSQIHFVNSEETLLVRGGFNHVIKASVIHRSSSGFFYILPHNISELKQKESNLKNKQEEILVKICRNITNIFEKNLMFLKFINKEFDRFDHYQARVFFAKINDKSFILPSKSKTCKLIDFKHPALHDAKSVSVDFSKSVIMITGVNAGGKTMLLKSILSAVILSKYLLPYNANEKSIIGSFKEILAVLDDPQNVKNDISTFAGRMVEFSKLFTKKEVIVGVDEIELGTDSDEAASLFKVIIDELISKDIKIIITTHHKRLAALMAANENVDLIAALYDEENRKPTYEFLQGTIGKSYAFETAQRYGIPLGIIKRAKEVYGEDKDKLNELIQRSSDLEREYKTKILKLDNELENYERLTLNLKEQKATLDAHIYTEKSKLHKEYKDVKEEAKKAIKAKKIEQSHQHLNIAHNKVSKIKTQSVKESESFKVGDRVKYNNSKGEILSIKGTKAFILNDLGMRLQVELSALQRSGNIPKLPPKKVSVNVEKPQTGRISLDLHGQRSDEAVENLDKFISDSLIAGFDEILVYHGIGTGKLAYAVKKYLDSHPRVKGYSDAHPSSGGFGAKLIQL